jgi:hypothetical protein
VRLNARVPFPAEDGRDHQRRGSLTRRPSVTRARLRVIVACHVYKNAHAAHLIRGL